MTCHSCLKQCTDSFCTKCRKLLFGKSNISHVLPFGRPTGSSVMKSATSTKISISGVQPKFSLKLVSNALELTTMKGEYILKTTPLSHLDNIGDMVANEHVTMQLAKQVFGLRVAECAVMEFNNNVPVYLTRRFDVNDDGTRTKQEDFAQLGEISESTHGPNHKYESLSYEGISNLMQRHIPTYDIDVEEFFKLVLFNYLVQNGDAHIKNFSVYTDPKTNTTRLTPAYDLLNTHIHLPNDGRCALDLFDGGYETPSFSNDSFYRHIDFHEFGIKIGVPEKRVIKFLDLIVSKETKIHSLLDVSFMSKTSIEKYKDVCADRQKALMMKS